MPNNLADALALISDGGTVIAGGTDVFPAMQQGKMPDVVLDVTGIPAFRGITVDEHGWRIGSATTWTEIAQAELPPAFDGLKQAARQVGGIQIQNAGTIAGNICNASPAADGVPPLLTLDASVEVASTAKGTRQIPLEEFILGVRKTALAPDELLTGLHIPMISDQAGSAFEKLGSRAYLVISITMTAAIVSVDHKGIITEARIAVGACSPVAIRLKALEESLIGQSQATLEIDPQHLSALTPIDDVRGSKSYRLDVVAEQCLRAIRGAVRHA